MHRTVKACTVLADKEAEGILGGKVRKVASLEIGMAIHVQAWRSRLELDLCVASSLVDMYCKCRSLGDARRVFDRMKIHDTVSWNSLILGYAQNGDGKTALKLFETMLAEGCVPVRSSFLAALEACSAFSEEEECQFVNGKVAKVVSLETAMAIHSRVDAEAAKHGVDIMVANTLIDVYAKCGSMTDAQRVFDGMKHHNLVSWTVLMFGYAQNDRAKMVLEVFSQMRYFEEWIPSSQAFVAVIQAAADMAALAAGKRIHGDVCRLGLELEAHIQSSLVDLYGKCGSTVGSQVVFDSASSRGIEMWSAVMAGHSRQGDHSRVFELFEGMVRAGVRPNAITFLSLQITCSRAGLVDKAWEIFSEMQSSKFGIRPGIEHYHCLIDLLGRANQIDKAVEVVESMPVKATAVTWMTVLGACQKWKNSEIGKRAFDAVVRLDREKEHHAAAYVLLAEIFEAN
ncbi:pentatricopeptide repeat-containing protein At4g39530-like [Selaginella moellendorffii]|uniref:pentatricopeptide repeat-containing protein At4g39530-like n=1 Tax=Selaginella moellendorffii TaxID=88036 RepID=UPI000D1CD62E|nr:pentatricopeptide repeat-containing protein At4g39530-like [Selaginella moellendorffii]|eukprot:XP_024519137.1 pentatricopeptide repeat-containing protein At4g39530-like [Selaginella moellendorffii]